MIFCTVGRYIYPFNTLHGCYNSGNDSTIKAKPTTIKKAPIYIYPWIELEEEVHKNFLLHPHYFLQTLAILTLASEALWQALHWWLYFPLSLSQDLNWLWATPVWTNISTDDLGIISLALSVGMTLEHPVQEHSSISNYKFRWSPALTQILRHWPYKFSH